MHFHFLVPKMLPKMPLEVSVGRFGQCVNNRGYFVRIVVGTRHYACIVCDSKTKVRVILA